MDGRSSAGPRPRQAAASCWPSRSRSACRSTSARSARRPSARPARSPTAGCRSCSTRPSPSSCSTRCARAPSGGPLAGRHRHRAGRPVRRRRGPRRRARRACARGWRSTSGAMGAKSKNFYVELAERHGHGAAAREVQDAGLAGDRPGAAAALTDELVDAGAIATRPPGSTTGWRPTQRAGVNTLVAVPCGDDKPAARRCARWPRPSASDGCVRAAPDASRRPEGIAGSPLPGPFPVGAYAAKLREELRKRARVQLFGEVWNLRPARRRKVYFELRDGDGALPCSMWRNDFERSASAGRARRRRAGRRRRRPGLLPGLADLLAVVLLRRHRRCASPARATCSPSSSALRRTLDAEGLFEPQKRAAAPGAAAHDRRRHRRGRQGARRRARRPAPARLGRPARLGLRARCRTATPRRAITRALQDLAAVGEVEVDRRRPRRRLAGRPVRLLRRDAVPDGRAAARAGDRLGRPPHRPHADRRRRRGAAARRRRTPPRSAVPAAPRRGARGAARAAPRGWRHHGRRAVARPRPRTSRALSRAPAEHRRAPPRARCTSGCARCAPARAGASSSDARAHRARARSCSRARPTPARGPETRAARARSTAWPPRWPPTTPSASSSAATRSSTTARASSSPAPRQARAAGDVRLCFGDGDRRVRGSTRT